MLNIIDLFCGTAGFSHGFSLYEPETRLLYALDIDPIAVETASLNHPNAVVEVNDIRNVDLDNVEGRLKGENVDIIIGGPPCQGFSSIRPNRSFNAEDERNNLFVAFARFVERFKPDYFIMENVVGIATHKDGSTLDTICHTFSDLGYSFDWRILNAANYGVPQKRERFIMIGSKSRVPPAFPEPTHAFEGKVIGYHDKNKMMVSSPWAKKAITVAEAIGDLPILERNQCKTYYATPPQNAYQALMRGQESTLTLHKATNHSDRMMEVIRHAGDSIKNIPKELISSGFSSCYSRMRANEPGNTITVKFQSPSSSKCIHPFQNRTITPREAARLQSFPDGYLFSGSYTQIAGQLGNAVPPLLGKVLAAKVIGQRRAS